MLYSLHIKNLAIVDEQAIDFNDGLTVITGETGAGKSILLNALNLILGERANNNLIQHNQQKGNVVAQFNIAKQENIINWLVEQDLENSNDCLIRRTLSIDGKSKAFINGTPVTLNQLKELGELLIDIHNQNEHYSLLQNSTQMRLLDEYAKTTGLVNNINELKYQHQELSQQIVTLEDNNEQQAQQIELLEHYLKELTTAQLEEEELTNIESRYKIMINCQELINNVANIQQQLNADDGINQKLIFLSNAIGNAQSLDEKLTETQKLINESQVQIQEASYNLDQYLSNLEHSGNSNSLEIRLNELHSLSNKHNISIPNLLTKKTQLETQLAVLLSNDSDTENLKNKLNNIAQEHQNKSQQLSKIRGQKALSFASEITSLIQTLGMSGSVFKITLLAKEQGIYLNGNESISFDIKTNTGTKMQSLNKIASGGELSRISLAIAVVSAQFYSLPTVIFDEVDVGISGAVAQIVGQKLSELSKTTQVICITHLPQVAAYGLHHLKVIKSAILDKTNTKVVKLNKEEKVEEIARLVGGINISDKTRLVAEELIKN